MMDKYEKIKYLVQTLNKWTKLYDEGRPAVQDEVWDDLYFELKDLENKTGLILSNSPTQTISYEVVNALIKNEHNHKMLSLEKTKSSEEVANFIGNKSFLAMCKMDGLTCSLTYKNGELFSAETRGTGLVGENILHNAKVLSSIPKHIPHKEEITIDGEIICTYKDFEEFQDKYKNPRNFAAGSIRLLDARECAGRKLTFIAWDVITSLYSEDGIEYRLDQKLEYISSFGFTIVPYLSLHGNFINDYDEVINEIKDIANLNRYPIDGIVFKFNDCDYSRSLGETTHHFKNALAFKFADDIYTSTLLDIDWTMGRTGILTPTAVFKAIDIDGSNIERASLHNVSIMQSLLKCDSNGYPYLNQNVNVFKSNEIIPQIASSYMDSNEDLTAISIPEVCPVCGEPVELVTDNESTFLKCVNSFCEGKLINRIEHFCGKKGLDIKGISKATIEKLINWGWLENFADIFELASHKDEWVQKPGFGIKSVEKVLNAINTGVNCELHQFIAALGIPLIGSTAAKELAKHFETWEKFVEAAEGGFAFYTLPNFGSEMHNSIVEFNYAEARLLADHYIHFNVPEVSESASGGSDLTGKTFAITGKLIYFKNRDEIKSKIEALGGKVTGSVSKNTDFLINNDLNSTSSKNVSAKSLGIPILTETDFMQAFGIG